jgi:hypothetical protein
MHEEHHQRTEEKDQVREHAQEMSGMLGEQKESSHGQKSEQDQRRFA